MKTEAEVKANLERVDELQGLLRRLEELDASIKDQTAERVYIAAQVLPLVERIAAR